MDLHLIALWTVADVSNLLVVILALGFVIFVHELGHFVVAKLCGVKCEKFYLGFDVGGWKLLHFRWGETEYGIGVVPLGGYVKMLGQEDNPAKLREELERARLSKATAQTDAAPGTAASGDAPAAADTQAPPEPLPTAEELRAAEQALYDPRSYLAMSVPKRMAIISAGVIMNMIFAVLMAIWAYHLGVKEVACGVGAVVPGEAAWKANIRPGDRIEAIAGKKTTIFRDLLTGISLGNLENGLPITLRRPGVPEPFTVTAYPDHKRGKPTIGVAPAYDLTLDREQLPTLPGSSARQAQPPFEKGDRIEAIDGVQVQDVGQLDAQLALHPEKTVVISVQRAPAKGAEAATKVNIQVAPNPMRWLGLVMAMGQLTAVQPQSPAAKAGLQKNDFLQIQETKNLIPPGQTADPMQLPQYFRAKTGDTLVLKVSREGVKQPLDIPVTIRAADWIEQPLGENGPMTIPQIGVAYEVLNRVQAVVDKSPAAAAGLRPGDVITQAQLIPPPPDAKDPPPKQKAISFDFNDQKHNWPLLMYTLQRTRPGTRVELTLADKRVVQLEPTPASDWFNEYRGLRFEPKTITQRAENWSEAAQLGYRETMEATTMVFGVLSKLGTQISVSELSGPVGIFQAATQASQEGFSKLLIFLTMLSANLAVLNFLPIPVLDGGHMLFLLYEGIRGKPADERLQLALTYAGLFFILALMIFVLGLDINRLWSW